MTNSVLARVLEARKTRKRGAQAILEQQRGRLADLVSFARENSPYYRELYRGLAGRVEDTRQLPVTNKSELMPRFDEWVTDPAVTIARARAFVQDPALIGQKFLDRYTVTTTSGSTGVRGIFVMDDRSMVVTQALAARMVATWLSPADILSIVAGGGRLAMIIATGGHFASAVAASRLRTGPRRRERIKVFPVSTPMSQLVDELNRFRPAVLAPYATTGMLLAGEQEAGRLNIDPVLIVLAAEGLSTDGYGRIARAFGAKVRQSYAATECPFLSFSCEHEWLHVNSDWAILEPVDADHRPVPAGEQSHTALLSNLANRVQPVLRYDLGDSILVRPDPCPCGDPLPAIRVQGRTADLLTFQARHGGRVTIPPLTISALVDRIPGVKLFQILQTPTSLDVRLQTDSSDDLTTWSAVHLEISRLLADHDLGHVAVSRALESPQQTAGGKYRAVIKMVASG